MSETAEQCRNRWTGYAEDLLVGRTIVGVRYMTPEECEEADWYRSAVVLQLDDGTQLFPAMDDEGNNAGALFTTDVNTCILPVTPLYDPKQLQDEGT